MQVRKTWSPDSLIEVSDLVRNLPNSLLLEDSTNNYMKIDSINSGGFGEVTKFLDTKTLNHIAGKLIKFSFKMVELSQQKKRLESFLTEFARIKSVCPKSEYLINYFAISTMHDHLIVLSTYFENGSVKDLLKEEDGLAERLALKYFYQTLKALLVLHNHSPPIIHGNIKASNLMLATKDQIKLTDFGFIREFASGRIPIEDSAASFPRICYSAPEIISGSKSYDRSSDVWALGCTLVEMILKNPPYMDFYSNYLGKTNRIKHLKYDSTSLIPTGSKLVKYILDQTFEKDPSKRASVETLIRFIDHLMNCKFQNFNDVEDTRFMNEARRLTQIEELYRDPYTEMSQKKRQIFHTQKQAKISIHSSRGEQDVKRQGIVAAPLLAVPLLSTYSKSKKKNGIFCKTITYMLMFLGVGFITLSIFLFVALGVIAGIRMVIIYFCNCDLNSPHHLIISGIFMILFVAMLFSCCIMGLGEFRFRMSNKKNQDHKPDHNIKFCGVTVIKAKQLVEDYHIESYPDDP